MTTVNNDSLTVLPTITLVTQLSSNIVSLSRSQLTGTPSSKALTYEQSIAGSSVLDESLTDFYYRVVVDNKFLTINGMSPDSVQNDIAVYTIEANSNVTSQNLTSVTFTLVAKDVSDSVFSSYKQSGANIVEKVMTVTGMSSGAEVVTTIQIV